ncbi:MAG: DUF5666 domain-containing protein, partial [Alphaproteobacteria bacterium]
MPSALAQSDRGIGGTGAPIAQNNDWGIGGTGLYGTITGFGSIIVNGRHVTLPASTSVLIDGQAGTLSGLQLGQIAKITTTGTDRALQARRVEINRVLIGTVESTSFFGRRIVVLGHSVLLPSGAAMPLVGERVAIDGLRRPDGVISANRITLTTAALDQVVGVVSRNAAGALAIGEIELIGAPRTVSPGARIIVRGKRTQAGIEVATVRADPLWTSRAGARRLSIESYVARSAQGISLGDGVTLPANAATIAGLAAIAGEYARVVVDIEVSGNGNWRAVTVSQSGAGTGGSGGGGSAGPGGGPPGGPGGG